MFKMKSKLRFPILSTQFAQSVAIAGDFPW
jgi:hypothetical protein